MKPIGATLRKGWISPRGIAALVVVAILLIVPPVLREATTPPCGEGAVMSDGGCVASDRLTVLARDGQTRTEIEAAVAKYDGIVTSPLVLDKAGIYVIELPPMTATELDHVRAQLVSDGFDASLSPVGELFAARTLRARAQTT